MKKALYFQIVQLLLLHLSLLFDLNGQLHAQDNKEWEVVKIRGAIYSDKTQLKVGSKLKEGQNFYFTNTSDVMLVRQHDICHFVKPANFSVNVKNGQRIQKDQKTLEHYKAEWEQSIITSAKFHKNRIPTKCDKPLEKIFKGRNMPKHKGCTELWVDETWGIYRFIEIDDYVYPMYKLEKVESISSPSCKFKAVFEKNGNFVLNNSHDNRTLWSSGTNKAVGAFCKMNQDGSLVIYDRDNNPVWATNTSTPDCECSYLLLTDDGNLQVINPDDQIKWETRTWGGTKNTNPLGHIVTKDALAFSPAKQYRIRALDKGLVLSIGMKTGTKGTPVLSSTTSGSDNQRWTIMQTLEWPYYNLRTGGINYLGRSGNVLDISLFNNASHQEWDIAPTGTPDLFYIRNTGNGFYLEVKNNSVQLSPFTGKRNQMWRIEEVKP